MPDPKTAVILDLDNTLWDWVATWYASFSAMLRVISDISGLPEVELLPAVRRVHQRHGTSEYTFLIEELEVVHHPNESRRELLDRFRPAIEAFRDARRRTLALYPSVAETLWALYDRRVSVVAYTESTAYHTAYRVRRLGLDGLLNTVYSPEDHDLPRGMTREQLRSYPESRYEFKRTIHKHTPLGAAKPNPDILHAILEDLETAPADAVYVGDSLLRDISMAQDAGVADVYAAYGEARDTAAYELLKAVTHWTDADVQREKQLRARPRVEASLVFGVGLAELFDHFRFAVSPAWLPAPVPRAPIKAEAS